MGREYCKVSNMTSPDNSNDGQKAAQPPPQKREQEDGVNERETKRAADLPSKTPSTEETTGDGKPGTQGEGSSKRKGRGAKNASAGSSPGRGVCNRSVGRAVHTS